ncbi:unnamed protein product [Linum tenue]|uniref:Uncharacterized protein n=1 Tax=Linum tenue TaxID=586396 RepID=A0AAV0NTD9_9ROSI|nr:unnamed protein product [Linum tenue]
MEVIKRALAITIPLLNEKSMLISQSAGSLKRGPWNR